MRIVVNDIAASDGGAMTVLKQFYGYVLENGGEHQWIFLLSDRYLEPAENIEVRCYPEIKASRIRKFAFDCFTGKKELMSIQPDVVLSLQNIITFGLHVPQAVYIHQAIPFQDEKHYSFLRPDERKFALIQYGIGGLIKASARKADKVIVQTEWMRRAVAEKAHISADKIAVSFPQIKKGKLNSAAFCPNRFFYPTSNVAYKNVATLVRACDRLNSWGITDFELRLTLPEGTVRHKNIKCIGYLNSAQMQEEYWAGTLLFPSYIETVGLPMPEARALGTMVAASDTAFSHECLDGYENARFLPATDAEAWAKIMRDIIEKKVILCTEISASDYSADTWGNVLNLLQNRLK